MSPTPPHCGSRGPPPGYFALPRLPLFLFAALLCVAAVSAKPGDVRMFGGVNDVNDSEERSEAYETLARFAVAEQNKQMRQKLGDDATLVKFVRVVKVQQQVVAGLMLYLTLHVLHFQPSPTAAERGQKGEEGNAEAGETDEELHEYVAKVWERPWMSFRELQSFTYKGPVAAPGSLGFCPAKKGKSKSTKKCQGSTTAPNTEKKKGEDKEKEKGEDKEKEKEEDKGADDDAAEGGVRGGDFVSVDEPSVKEAAEAAVVELQKRSNSLTPLTLHRIVDAKKLEQENEEGQSLRLTLLLQRGDKKEAVVALMHQSGSSKGDGGEPWRLKQKSKAVLAGEDAVDFM
eukprot:TRINITY_DN764_c0_g1_i2.p1 TRINITY_DN764_c0_g1~~TRINITY_DN764_c0_g1_i2.p1  ORF type:complete len:344 (+),score=120.80 TRINITY_DN764_c0_g1_i2:104-1135(+)